MARVVQVSLGQPGQRIAVDDDVSPTAGWFGVRVPESQGGLFFRTTSESLYVVCIVWEAAALVS